MNSHADLEQAVIEARAGFDAKLLPSHTMSSVVRSQQDIIFALADLRRTSYLHLGCHDHKDRNLSKDSR